MVKRIRFISKRGGYYLSVEKGSRPLNKNFRSSMLDQVIYYKGKPYFLRTELSSLRILEPFSARNFHEFGFNTVCEFSIHDNGRE